MSEHEDPFVMLAVEEDDSLGAGESATPPAPPGLPSAVTARLHGFDLEDRPLLGQVPGLAGEIVAARTTVPLQRAHIGATVVVVFEDGQVRRPIVLGVIADTTRAAATAITSPAVSVQQDDQRLVLSAEREIVLRCGSASVTLTRAGKVLIKGTYVLSRSSGYNRIKGAAVDIN